MHTDRKTSITKEIFNSRNVNGRQTMRIMLDEHFFFSFVWWLLFFSPFFGFFFLTSTDLYYNSFRAVHLCRCTECVFTNAHENAASAIGSLSLLFTCIIIILFIYSFLYIIMRFFVSIVVALPSCVCARSERLWIFFSHSHEQKSPSNTRKLHRRLFGYAHQPTLYRVSQNKSACKKLHTTKYNELYLGSRLFSRYFFCCCLFFFS